MPAKHTPATFWKRVNKSTPDKCWDWTGSTNSTGYGSLQYQGTARTAHRVAAYLSGMIKTLDVPIDKSVRASVLHKCDNRLCCNPNHFFIGNYSDNQKDCYTKSRRQQPKGELHANAKLTNQQAHQIRNAYANGATQMQLAAEFQVSQRVISLIVRMESYV